MGISMDVNSLSIKANRERAMSIASTREMRNLYPGTCVPKHAKIFYILPKRDTKLTLEEDLKVGICSTQYSKSSHSAKLGFS